MYPKIIAPIGLKTNVVQNANAESNEVACASVFGVSRPTELPRQPLAEPYVNLSTHTAPIKQHHLLFLCSNEQKVLVYPY